MNLQITSITAPKVGELINGVTIALEDRLRPHIESCDYGGGIQQLVVFFVAGDSDPLENERYCRANNRSSRYKHMFTGQMVKFVGIAIPLDPATALRLQPNELTTLMKSRLLAELEAPAYAMPKKFDRERMLADFQAVLGSRDTCASDATA